MMAPAFLERVLAEPCLSVRRGPRGTEGDGPARFFRGHTIPRPGGADGIFAAWTWDGRSVVVRNDRYGVAPLFYCADGDRFSVSPSILRLIAAGAPTDLDEPALSVFLRLGQFVGEDTPFRAIRAVPPNALIIWRDGVLSTSAGMAPTAVQRVTRDQALDAFIALFRQAIARRLPPDADAVVPLSGGCDSRHILFELWAAGRLPRLCVTIPRYPPRAGEDERIAPLVAAAVGVPHRLIEQDDRRLPREVRKNWATHLCSDEHTWFMPMIESLTGTASAVYDGLGGGLPAASRFLSRDVLSLFDAGRTEEIADRFIATLGRFDEAFLERVIHPDHRAGLARDRAVARIATELARHAAAPDPVKSFNFWNRIRRELALVPYALMKDVPLVYSPSLDHDLYDFLMGLPPTVMSPTLSASDKSFHSEAIHRAFPQFAAIPFERKDAPRRDARRHDARFAADVARFMLTRRRGPKRVLNGRYVFPRLLFGLAHVGYRQSHRWLAGIALYLFQLELAAGGRLTLEERRPARSGQAA